MAKKPAKKNAGPGNPARRAAQAEMRSRLAPTDQRVLREFTSWASAQEHLAAPSVELETQGLNGLLASVRAGGLDPTLPESTVDLVDVGVAKVEDARAVDPSLAEQIAGACFGVLGDYLRFREATSPDPAAWQRARFTAQHRLDDHFGAEEAAEEHLDQGSALSEHLDDAAAVAGLDLEPGLRRDAVMGLGPMAGIGDLLAWIGEGRDTDRAGEPLEADRPTVFGFVVPQEPYTDEDLPLLTSWWDNLITSEVLDVARGRVTAGQKGGWDPAGVPVERAEETAQGLVAEVVTRITEDHGRVEATELTAWTLAPALPGHDLTEAQIRTAAEAELDDLDAKAAEAVAAAFAALSRLGFVTGDREHPEVPAPLRRTVAYGLRLAMVYTMLDEDDLFGDGEG